MNTAMYPARNWDVALGSFTKGVFALFDTTGEPVAPGGYADGVNRVRALRRLRGDALVRLHEQNDGQCYVCVELCTGAPGGFVEPKGSHSDSPHIHEMFESLRQTYEEWIGDGSGVRWIVGVPTRLNEPLTVQGDGWTIRVSSNIPISFMVRETRPICYFDHVVWNRLISGLSAPQLDAENFLLTLWKDAGFGYYSTKGREGRNERQVLEELGVVLPERIADRHRVIKEEETRQAAAALAAEKRGDVYRNPFMMWNDLGTAVLSPLTDSSFVGAPWQTSDIDYYFAPLGFRHATKSRKAKGADRVVNCVFLDADPVLELIDDPPALDVYFQTIEQSFLLPPSIVVNSGGGRHFYWVFGESLRLNTDAERNAFLGAMKRWKDTVHSKETPIDTPSLSSVLRIPGTKNWKARYHSPMPVMIERYDERAQYDYQELLERISAYERRSQIVPAAPVNAPTYAQWSGAPLELPVDPAQHEAYVQNRLAAVARRLQSAQDGERHRLLMSEIYTLGGLHAAATDDGVQPLRSVCTIDRCRDVVFDAIDANPTAEASQASARSMFNDQWEAGMQKPFRVVTAPTPVQSLPVPPVGDVRPLPQGVLRMAASGRFSLVRPSAYWPHKPEPKWIIPGLVPRTGYCILYAERDNLKTAFMTHLCFESIIAHHDVTGEKACIVYIATENEGGFGWRMIDWIDGSGHDKAQIVDESFVQFTPESQRFELLDQSLIGELAAEINALDVPVLGIVIDTLRMAFTGSGNDDEIGAQINRAILTLMGAVYGEPFVFALHHTGLNSERMRGTTAIGDNTMLTARLVYKKNEQRLLVNVERMKWESPPTRPREWAVQFNDVPRREAEAATEAEAAAQRKRKWVSFLELTPDTGPAVVGETWTVTDQERRVLQFMADNQTTGGVAITTIMSLEGGNERTMRRHINALQTNRPDGRPAMVHCVEAARGARPAMLSLTPPGLAWVAKKNAKEGIDGIV
jgi:hypothetical protein